MKYLLFVSIFIISSCGSDSDSNFQGVTVPDELRGVWIQDCDTEGFDRGSLLTTQVAMIEFTANTRSLTRTVYDENNCSGNIFDKWNDEGVYSEVTSVLTNDGVEGTAAKITYTDGTTVFFAFHVDDDFLYLDAWYPGSNSIRFDYTRPFYRQ